MGPNGIALLTESEALRLTPYNDPRNFATVGYGHLIRRGPVVAADQPITREQALEYLIADLVVPETIVFEEVVPQLNQNQFDAVVDFVYNEGAGNFERSSLLTYLNNGLRPYDPGRVAVLLGAYDEGGGRILPGLITRRAKEAELFNTPV